MELIRGVGRYDANWGALVLKKKRMFVTAYLMGYNKNTQQLSWAYKAGGCSPLPCTPLRSAAALLAGGSDPQEPVVLCSHCLAAPTWLSLGLQRSDAWTL